MAVTLKEIATRLGVSGMTVSTALTGRGRVSDKTRRRVLDAAKEMGYRPNTSARSMRVGRFGNIGLLLSDAVKNSYLPAGLLRGIQAELEKSDVQLTVGRMPDAMLTKEGYVPALLRHWSADGLLINYQEGVPSRMIELIEQDHVPAVWLNSKQHDACVHIDDHGCGRLAAEALLNAGHTRIGYVDYSHGLEEWDAVHYSARDRFEGARDALADAGLKLIDLRGARMLDVNERQPFSHQWLSREDRPTAVVCYSASSGMPVVLAAWRMGLMVPRDLSVVCIDEHPNGSLGFNFTSVLTPLEEMGHAAVQAVLRRIEDGNAGGCEAIPGHLEPGDSVVPPGA